VELAPQNEIWMLLVNDFDHGTVPDVEPEAVATEIICRSKAEAIGIVVTRFAFNGLMRGFDQFMNSLYWKVAGEFGPEVAIVKLEHLTDNPVAQAYSELNRPQHGASA
jgi:hypothetical protein